MLARVVALLIGLAPATGLISALGQTAAPSPPGDGPKLAATLRTDVDEVELDLVVHDRKRRPVVDLKQEELAVTDNGVPVHLARLRLVTPAEPSEHRVALVFDHAGGAAGKSAENAAAKLLKSLPQKDFLVSVAVIGSRLRLLQPYTADRGAIAQAVRTACLAPVATLASEAAGREQQVVALAQTGLDAHGAPVDAMQRAEAASDLGMMLDSQRTAEDRHAPPWIAGLMATAEAQRQHSGRRAIVYFSQSGQGDLNTNDQARTLITAANRDGVSIYTVDLTLVDESVSDGLLASMAIGRAAAGQVIRAAPTPGDGLPRASTDGATPQVLTPAVIGQNNSMAQRLVLGGGEEGTLLEQLAAGTGGIFLRASQGIKQPIQRIVDDLTIYYQASYPRAQTTADGSFHPVSFRALRGGVSIAGRSGYYDRAADAPVESRAFEAPLLALLDSASALPTDVAYTAGVRAGGGGGNRVGIEVPLSSLELHRDPNTRLYSAEAVVMARIREAGGDADGRASGRVSGRILEHFSEQMRRHGAIESADHAGSETLAFTRTLTLPAGRYVLETAVLDTESNKAGARRVTFELTGEAGAGAQEATAKQAAGALVGVPMALEKEPPEFGNAPRFDHAALSDLGPGPADRAEAPAAEAQALLVEGARANALHYAELLPNFFCVETTERLIDRSGRGNFRSHDRLVQVLHYQDHQETRKVVSLNGERSAKDSEEPRGARSVGQFGGALVAIFDPSAKAAFQWQRAATLDGEPVEVFAYQVRQADSVYQLTGDYGESLRAGFHGIVAIDAATHGVRRLTLTAEDLPAGFSIRASLLEVDYAYVGINHHDYLMPTSGQLRLRQGRREQIWNRFRFSGYRRFGAQVRMMGSGDAPATAPQSQLERPGGGAIPGSSTAN